MKRFSIFCLLALMISVPRTTYAAVFEHDWQDPNDGLLTYDDVNQREWLDVPVTLLSQYSGTTEDRFQTVVAQTAPGGLYEGFSVAESTDVLALALSAGIDPNTTSLSVNETATRNLIGLLGETVQLSAGQAATYSLLDEFSTTEPTSRLVGGFVVVPPTDTAGFGMFPFSDFGIDHPTSVTGVMLYREIPEPSSLLSTILAAFLLLHRRDRGCSAVDVD